MMRTKYGYKLTATDFCTKCSTVFSPLATTNRSIFLHAILPRLPNSKALVPEDEVPDIRPNEDTDYDVPIVVHGQQHDKVRHRKLQHVQQRADRLLQYTRAKAWRRGNW